MTADSRQPVSVSRRIEAPAEELFEVLAWQTLKIHTKPVVLLNVAGFYDRMLEFLDVCEIEGMLRGNRERLLVATTVEEALELCGLDA